MKRNWIFAVGLALAIGVLGFASAAAADEAPPASEAAPAGEAAPLVNCGSGVVCVFTEILFNGAEGQTNCGAEGAHPLAGTKHSGINHCANRAVWFRINGTAHYCRNAGDQLEVGEFNELWVGASGSHC